MEDPAKKELIKGITEFFDDYEEAYVPGEWESFSQAGRKKYPFFSSWVKIAAILLLLLSVLLFQRIDFRTKNKGNNIIAVNKAKQGEKSNLQKQEAHVPGSETAKGAALAMSSPLLKRAGHTGKNDIQTGNTIVSGTVGVPEPARLTEKVPDSAVVSAGNQGYAAVQEKHPVAVTDVRRPDSVAQKRSTADFLRDEAKTIKLAVADKKEEKDKWNFGVEVMPSMSKSNLNVGAGLTTAYRLSKSFSLSSGISILQLQASGTVAADPGMAGQQVKSSLAPKQLLAIDANISAIDIPIGLVYNVNKNFYTSIGVSYFNVIREKRNNTYLTPLGAMYDSPVSSAAYQVLKSEPVEERVTDKPLSGNSYLGFFNFSVGRQQNVFNGHQILIEPFIKIPVGKLSSQDLPLMNSGIKFKLSF
jgi:hypothetical protein